ncbi:MAG TPA: lipocalin-like domain-containing protein [Burkholderiales bacterium]|nr:lipocalin-like domain-containing protein [Burkholderiales bacterium]
MKGGLLALLCLCLLPAFARAAGEYPQVRPGAALQFPRDYGSHPDFRNEWWYITGWLRADDGRDLGMQITFFRNRPRVAEDVGSRFAPRQLLFAHAALSDPASGKLLHDQRAARSGLGLAEALEGRTEVAIEDWSLKQAGGGYAADVTAREFRYKLRFEPTQGVLLEGERGFSRKGPGPGQASYYYSQPHLAVSGRVLVQGAERGVSGEAWLDHEWSSEPLAEGAVGWDWIGINLDGGGALMAFRIRSRDGGSFWAGGSFRAADGRVRPLKPAEVRFSALRRWRSPRTGAEYPVSVRVDAGPLSLEVEPLMDDQELDARASTGTVYWEGAVRAKGGKGGGRGYLELTGYWKPLKL